METRIVSSSNFDQNFKKLLNVKKGKNIANGRLCLESIKLNNKAELIILLISSLKSITSITYKILFWEEDVKVEEFLSNKKYKKVSPYKNGKKPGIIFIDNATLDMSFLKSILDNHLNFEMAKEPSQNLRIQICVNLDDIIILLDIYDDRGLDIYYIPNPKSYCIFPK